jgi:hypothetical protein
MPSKKGRMKLRPYGWDERDYKLWSEIQSLPSFGIISDSVRNWMISFKDVERCMETAAKKRGEV